MFDTSRECDSKSRKANRYSKSELLIIAKELGLIASPRLTINELCTAIHTSINSKSKAKSPRKTPVKKTPKKTKESPKKTNESPKKSPKTIKTKKSKTEEIDYFLPNPDLDDRSKSYCRCVLHVAKNQTEDCLRRQAWKTEEIVNGKVKKCYNPYSICTGSVRRKGAPDCFTSLDLNKLRENDPSELDAYAALGYKNYGYKNADDLIDAWKVALYAKNNNIEQPKKPRKKKSV